jgi:hypothetical protein
MPTSARKSYLAVQRPDGSFAVQISGFPTMEWALDEITRLKAIDATLGDKATTDDIDPEEVASLSGVGTKTDND